MSKPKEQPELTPPVAPPPTPPAPPAPSIEGVFEEGGRKFSRKVRNKEGDIEIVYLD